MVTIEIDEHSGFCFGVVNAIHKAEQELDTAPNLYCLGDIVHNTGEVDRLQSRGMTTIGYEHLADLPKGARVLFRAHGEPPEVYAKAARQGLNVVDATCPVVLKLQRSIRKIYEAHQGEPWQIVIFGKPGHAEVNGLVGQTEGSAIVISSVEDVARLDFSKPIELFSQTTMPLDAFGEVVRFIETHKSEGVPFLYHDTICRSVAMRIPGIRAFAARHTRIFFVAGRKSSNGQMLFAQCKAVNPLSFFLSDPEELKREMLPADMQANESIGICGATSSPRSQMEAVERAIRALLSTPPSA